MSGVADQDYTNRGTESRCTYCLYRYEDQESHIPRTDEANYYDSLATIALTPVALRELRRRDKMTDERVSGEAFQQDRRSIEQIMGIRDLESLNASLSPEERISQAREIRRTADLGGPDMQDLRGIAHGPRSFSDKTEHSPNQISSTPSQRSSRRRSTYSGPYDHNYNTILEHHGIFIDDSDTTWRDCRCTNCDEFESLIIDADAAMETGLAEFAEDEMEEEMDDYLDVRRTHLVCLDKAFSISDMKEFIRQCCPEPHCTILIGHWINMRSWSDDREVKTPFYHDPRGTANGYIGARIELLPSYLVTRFSDLIKPFVESPIILPNFIISVMSFGKELEHVAERSVVVAGAIATRAFREIRRAIRPESVLEPTASVIVYTALGGEIKFFTVLVEERNGSEEYHMKHLTKVKPFESLEDHLLAKHTMSLFLKWAEKQRNILMHDMRTLWGFSMPIT